MRDTDRFYSRAFGLATAAVLGAALFRILQPFLGPILWAALLAFLLFPANRWLCRVFRGRRGGAALVLTLAVTVLGLGPVAALGVAFVRQSADLIRWLEEVAARYPGAQAGDLLQVTLLARAFRALGRLTPLAPAQVQGWLVEAGRGLLQTLVSLGGSVFLGALTAVVGFVLMLFLLFFLLRDGEAMVGTLRALIPLSVERRERLIQHVAAVTRAVVLGALLTALIQGALVGTALAVVGLPSPLVFGALAVAASLVPLVGAALVWVPAAGVLAAQGRWGAALFVALWGLVLVSSADNVVRPLVISGRAQISTLPVFLGLVGGLGAFGPIGMFLGPVVVAVALALLRFAVETRGAPGAAGL